ncbi:hypothetical protein HJC23_009544 [Cyclotella cryptica]|uniref:Uncharacterized protein n=1 Tax=Cyclotella cryptica TaxID=29204 RepID=A0ABD3Q5W5_9STRA|eukprot:CCRYP_008872-RA/>CCRYP_008872-RA protein AED:0.10 eAED:0.10 QI:170/1/1/1/1/1/2/295/275
MLTRPSTLALIGIALLNNLASGFSCTTAAAAAPCPRLPLLRPPSASSKTAVSSFRQENMQRRNDQSHLGNSSLGKSLAIRGGALRSSAGSDDTLDLNLTTGKVLASAWGTCGVAYILIKAIKRVVPIAMEPFGKGAVALTKVELGAYILTCLWFAYVEGYKGFQLKFSPLVVARSFTLNPSSSSPIHLILAPLYSMGLFHATKKRMIVSWSVSLGVAAIVAAVKRLPYPWRNIVDAGVVVGLSWGTISMLGGYVISLVTGIAPIDVDPALPQNNK